MSKILQDKATQDLVRHAVDKTQKAAKDVLVLCSDRDQQLAVMQMVLYSSLQGLCLISIPKENDSREVQEKVVKAALFWVEDIYLSAYDREKSCS